MKGVNYSPGSKTQKPVAKNTLPKSRESMANHLFLAHLHCTTLKIRHILQSLLFSTRTVENEPLYTVGQKRKKKKLFISIQIIAQK